MALRVKYENPVALLADVYRQGDAPMREWIKQLSTWASTLSSAKTFGDHVTRGLGSARLATVDTALDLLEILRRRITVRGPEMRGGRDLREFADIAHYVLLDCLPHVAPYGYSDPFRENTPSSKGYKMACLALITYRQGAYSGLARAGWVMAGEVALTMAQILEAQDETAQEGTQS